MQQKPNRGRGWLLVAIVAGLVLLTGIYPLVAEPENRVMAAAIVGVAAIVLGLSAGPLRRGEPTVWKFMWFFPVFLVLMAVFIAITGDGTFGIVYLVFAVVAGLGLWVSRPDRGGVGREGDVTDSKGSATLSTRSARVNGERAIRIASWLFLINGIAWGLGSIPNAIYRYQLGRMPRIGDLETMGGPVSSQFGWEGVVWFLIPMGLLAWVEVLAGWWLRRRQKQGGWLALVSLPVWMFFPVVFLLPIWIALGPIRVGLVLAGWKSLR